MDLLNKDIRQKVNRQLITCEHGISASETCWWCQSTKDKPTNDRIDTIEEKFNALLGVVKLLIMKPMLQQGGAVVSHTTINQIAGGSLIQSGNDVDKPNDNNYAFYYATDSDTIYQRRDNTWIDISFSKPTGADVRITNIVTDDTTGSVEITDTA